MNTKDAVIQTPLTRTEVATAITSAFSLRSVTRDMLLERARHTGVRHEVVAALERLPAREYSDLRQVWADLPEMSVR